jgi:hypothetical protein
MTMRMLRAGRGSYRDGAADGDRDRDIDSAPVAAEA